MEKPRQRATPFEPAHRPKGARGMATTFFTTLWEMFVPAFPDPVPGERGRDGADSLEPERPAGGR